MFSLLIFTAVQKCSLAYFPGFFDDKSIVYDPPMSWIQVGILEINILMTMPTVEEIVSQWISELRRMMRSETAEAQNGVSNYGEWLRLDASEEWLTYTQY